MSHKIEKLLIAVTLGLTTQIVSAAGMIQHSDTIPDTTENAYYRDYSELLALRLYTNTKWNTLEIFRGDTRMILRPNSPTSFGAGFNYKDYGLALAVGLPKSKASNQKFGKTRRFDFQANVYGKKVGVDGFAQLYKGYYIANPQDFIPWDAEDPYPQLPDMRVVSLGINGFYLFNHDEFSYKATSVRNQVQLKSAGTWTLGGFGHFDRVETENGFKPTSFPDSVGAAFDLKAFSTLAIGISVGYMHTWVLSEHFFLNIGISPGFGNQRVQLETLSGEKSVKSSAAAQLSARSAFGYETRFLYAGLSGRIIWRNFQYRGYELDLATEQVRVFVGRRFRMRK